MKPGLELLEETVGLGSPVERHTSCEFRIRIWLHRGDVVRWDVPWGLLTRGRLEDERSTLFATLRVDREEMFAGLFYGVEGMRIGGTRRLRVSPHLAYGTAGVKDVIPANALLTVEVMVVAASDDSVRVRPT